VVHQHLEERKEKRSNWEKGGDVRERGGADPVSRDCHIDRTTGTIGACGSGVTNKGPSKLGGSTPDSRYMPN